MFTSLILQVWQVADVTTLLPYSGFYVLGPICLNQDYSIF